MTGPQDPLVPKNNKEAADHHEVGTHNLTGATGGGCKPPPSESDDERTNQPQPKSFRFASITRFASIAFSIAAIIVSAFAARFTYQQVEVAKDQVQVAKDTAEKQLRAYVHAVPDKVFHIDGGGRTLQAYVGIRNAGQTFAVDVERAVGIELFGADVPDEVSGLMKPEPGKFLIGPGGTNTTIRNFRPLKREESKQIKTPLNSRTDKDLRIYVIGKITYKDVWGDSHRTDFCFMYYGYEDAPHPDPTLGRLYLARQGKYCDKHNDAD